MLPVPPAGYGGIERIVDALLREYRTRGHLVGLVAHRDSCSPADERFSWPAPRRFCPPGIVRHALTLRRAVRAFRPEVVHSFSRLAYLVPLLRHGVPKVMSYQRHAGGAQITWAARLAGRSLRYTGCSEFICNMGRRTGGDWRAIPNFVEVDRFRFAPCVERDAPLVFLSRIESIKGADVAIAIARRAGRALILAGNRATHGPEAEYWERCIAPQIGNDGVTFIGEVDDISKRALLARAAALIVPVQWDEPFGIVFAEALAAGTPIITCARGALPEIVRPGETGFFIRSIEDGAEAVERLSTLDRAVCRRDAENRFSVGVCAAQYLRLYSEMMSTAGRSEDATT